MFKNPDEYPFVKELEAAYPVIRQEFDAFYADNRHRFIHWRAKDIGLDGWDIFGFNWFNRKFEDNMRYFPKTMRVLEAIPELTLSTLSRLGPHKSIEPHVGYDDNTLRGSMGIVVPENCTLVVGGEVRPMSEGVCHIFDDTTLHYAKNDSDQDRIVLLFDFVKQGKNLVEPLTSRHLDCLYKMHKRDWERVMQMEVVVNE